MVIPIFTLWQTLYLQILHSHILQELTVSSFVANDTTLAGGTGISQASGPDCEASNYHRDSSFSSIPPSQTDGPSVLIITGPNYSGKSVYLKQVALIVFMAHVGCFVPAHCAKIGVTDKILSRVTTRETVSREQSAFMIDLQQISLALNQATRRSLVIIDEFGKGTDSSDGAGLACAVFEHFLSLGVQCPKVVGATHFHGTFVRDIQKHELNPHRNIRKGFPPARALNRVWPYGSAC